MEAKMICRNCKINECEDPFDWCTECLDSQELTTKWFPQRQSEPRRIWETHYKREVPEGYHIHHKDGNHDNNDPENLICMSLEQHIKIHELAGDEIPLRILRRML
jgi:hypothetical protein